MKGTRFFRQLPVISPPCERGATSALDAGPVPLPERDAEAVIRLPSPTRVEIRYGIKGSDEEASV